MFNVGNDKIIINKELIDFPEIEGLNTSILKENYNETNLLKLLKNSYELVSLKKNKMHFDKLNDLSLSFIDEINKWNTKSIINIILNGDYDSKKDDEILFLLNMINFISDNNKTQVKYYLLELINTVIVYIYSLRKIIKEQALLTLHKLIRLSGNKDLDPFLPIVLKSLQDFNKVPEAIEQLAGCIFVQNIEYPALAIILPILERGLKNDNTEIKRKSCVIIDNMCKLVKDPKEIYPLIPTLKPLVSKCAENISNPEARGIAEKSLNTLVKSVGKYVHEEKSVDDIKKLIIDNLTNDSYDNDIDYLSIIITTLTNSEYFVYDVWNEQFDRYLYSDNICKTIYDILSIISERDEIYIDNEEGLDLYKGKFSLAYGTLTLLNNTHVHLKRNRFYGLLGHNNCGKTTLMRAIANEQVEGFPKRDELKTIFVEHEIQEREVGEDDKGYPILNIDLCGTDWVVDCCNEVYKMDPKVTREQVEEVMDTIGFGNSKKNPDIERAADCEMGVSTYSGGWKMKMQLCAATLMNADILMLDEPTGHLDVTNQQWLKDFLNKFKDNGGSIICTSHDPGFLNEMCSHIIDFQDRKLIMFRDPNSNVLKKFVEKYPEKNGYFVLKNDVMKFSFPEPKLVEGNKSASKTILKMNNVTYQYPIRDKPTVMDITLNCSMSSRVAVIGPNGAGKSTAIKLLIGELKPTSGDVWSTNAARVAYVAQHAFQHLEKNINKTPKDYILWRFAGNDDKESIDFKSHGEEVEEITIKKYYLKHLEIGFEVKPCTNEKEEKVSLTMDAIFTKRKNKRKVLEYEVCWKGLSRDLKVWVSRDILIRMGNLNQLQRFDEKMALAAGLTTKSLTSASIEEHLKGFGLDAEQASHTLISALSGGQKVKVVLAASLWLNPHLVILDEPTNYLDRDGLGALTKAIDEFKGGVVIISHNREFANAVSQEKWIMEKGRLRQEGESNANSDKKVTNDNNGGIVKDSWGNDVEDKTTKNLNPAQKKKEKKKLEKLLKILKKQKGEDHEEVYELQDEIDLLD